MSNQKMEIKKKKKRSSRDEWKSGTALRSQAEWKRRVRAVEEDKGDNEEEIMG